MTDIPQRVKDLISKYGDCEIIRVTQYLPKTHLSSTQGPHYGVGIFVKTSDDEFVLLRHSYDLLGLSMNDWTFPGGQVEENESFEDAAIRETFEETGRTRKISGLYKIFCHIHISDDEWKEVWFMPVFFGDSLSEEPNHESSEVLQIKKFKRLPKGFGGIFREYYDDLM